MNTCKVISVINFKGGVGKTTVTFNLGAELARRGEKVLLIDFDGQGNLSQLAGVENYDKTIITALYDVMNGEADKICDNLISSVLDGLDIIPCNIEKEKWLNEALTSLSRETIFRRFIDKTGIKNKYDYILIDNAPSINLDFQNSLVASDEYLIVTEAEIASTGGIKTVYGIIKQIRDYFNLGLKPCGIIINKAMVNTNLHIAVSGFIHNLWEDDIYIFKQVIPRTVTMGELSLYNLPICVYKPNSKQAEVFSNIIDEMLNQEAEN